jgi:hypothetical protein
MLSALAVENAKPRAKQYLLTDGNGLHLMVTPQGSKLWRLRYRFGGKQNIVSLGSFPAVSLADARGKRDEAQRLIAQGINPSDQKRQDRLVAEVAGRNTFGAIAEEHLQKLEEGGAAEATLSKNRWLLLDLASPLSKRPVAEITPAEILVLLQKYEKAGCARLRGGYAGSSAKYSAWQSQRFVHRPTRHMHLGMHLRLRSLRTARLSRMNASSALL